MVFWFLIAGRMPQWTSANIIWLGIESTAVLVEFWGIVNHKYWSADFSLSTFSGIGRNFRVFLLSQTCSKGDKSAKPGGLGRTETRFLRKYCSIGPVVWVALSCWKIYISGPCRINGIPLCLKTSFMYRSLFKFLSRKTKLVRKFSVMLAQAIVPVFFLEINLNCIHFVSGLW